MTFKNLLAAQFSPFAALALLLPFIVVPQPAEADQFDTLAGPPTLSPIALTENDGDIFTSIQPANSNSTDRYNLSVSAGLPGGHDTLGGVTMCWYLLDFEDCNDASTIEDQPEIVFKATQSVTRSGAEITSETFRVVGTNNYDVNVDGFESSSSVLREETDSVNVDIIFTFKVSNAMRASSNWKVYVEVEDNGGQTAAVVRDGIKIEYFAAMTLDREGVNFGGVAKGETSTVNNIDTGEYTANAQSQFFINASDFSAGTGRDLPILETVGGLGPNQVQLMCDRASNFNSTNAQLVTKSQSTFGDPIAPSSEEPEDAADHSCSVRFGQGQANNPNLIYTNTFTLAIAASPITSPRSLTVSDDVSNPVTQKKLTFDPPALVEDNQASIESYRILVVNSEDSSTEQTIRVTLSDLELGELGYDTESPNSTLTAIISNLEAGTNYEFIVEANTTRGPGSASTSTTTSSASLYEFSQATFTPGGNTGKSGPTFSQVLSGISGSDTNFSALQTAGILDVDNGIIEWTVPATGTYRITANGASGGTHVWAKRRGDGNYDSYGAKVQGDFSLTEGTVVKLVVGQRGEDSGTYFSNLEFNNSEGDNAGPGGGGGTFVYTDLGSDPLLAAGGGAGGTRNSYSNVNASLTNNAYGSQNTGGSNSNGGINGNGGSRLNGGSSYWSAAGAGWLTDGTGGNRTTDYDSSPGYRGAEGGQSVRNGAEGGVRWSDGSDSGGNGGFGGGGGGGSDNLGTGGGGGYSGGGGGNSTPSNAGGGGGGSFVSSDATNTSLSLRNEVAAGSVKIELLD